VTHNAALGQRDGVPKETFAALADYTTNPLLSDLERLVICYAEEMTETVQVDSRLVEQLKKQLGPQALVQLTLSIAAANFTNASTRRSARNWRLTAEEASRQANYGVVDFIVAANIRVCSLNGKRDPMSKLNETVALITGGSRALAQRVVLPWNQATRVTSRALNSRGLR
jgi:hypothetical protein